MLDKLLIFPVAIALIFPALKTVSPQSSTMTAEQIAEKNVAARGGLQAWRGVQALVLSGKMEAGGNARPTIAAPGVKSPHVAPPVRGSEQVRLPFVMEEKRPRKTRIEIQFKGLTAVQVFDGASGWKLRPYLNRHDVEPYTAEEMKMVALETDLDGPIVDYAAKGTAVSLDGVEKVDGRDTYKLKLAMKSGQVIHAWIDAETFLEAKIEGTPRRLDGQYHPVEIYYRDYRQVGGLKVPYLLETRVLNAVASKDGKSTEAITEQIAIDKVEINPKLDDSLFTKAQLEASAGGKPLATTAKVTQPQ